VINSWCFYLITLEAIEMIECSEGLPSSYDKRKLSVDFQGEPPPLLGGVVGLAVDDVMGRIKNQVI
jgi:hypothetical protein